MNSFKVGIIQMLLVDDAKANVEKAIAKISQTAKKGADIIVLPEMFNCPYKTKNFPIYAPYKDYAYEHLQKAAADNRIILIGGSIPEEDSGKIYNTCYIFDQNGTEIGKHRKMHLYDIDVEGGQYFKESEILSPGDTATIVDTHLGKFGVGICYDIRFPEYSRILSLLDAKVIFMPAAFNMTSGPAHWEFAFRSRALDNQVYMVGAAPARDINANYVAYGHSIVVSPWGQIIGQLDEKEGILMADIDLDYVEKIRREFPILKHRRTDIYQIKMRGKNIE